MNVCGRLGVPALRVLNNIVITPTTTTGGENSFKNHTASGGVFVEDMGIDPPEPFKTAMGGGVTSHFKLIQKIMYPPSKKT